MAEAPAPVPATDTTVVLPAALIAPLLVSRRRKGLYAPATLSALSTRTVLTRRQTPAPLWIHSTPSESRTCSNRLGEYVGAPGSARASCRMRPELRAYRPIPVLLSPMTP